MPEVMIGTPLSPATWFLVYALMWAVPVVICTVLFSVGSGLGPKEKGTVHEMPGKPAPKEEGTIIRHAA